MKFQELRTYFNNLKEKLKTDFKENKEPIIISASIFLLLLIIFFFGIPKQRKKTIAYLRYYLYDSFHTTTSHFFNSGVYYSTNSMLNLAIGSFRRALRYKKETFQINPNDPYQLESLYNLGVIYYNLKDYPKALFYFTKYLEIFPKETGVQNPHETDILNVVNWILSQDDKTRNVQAKKMKEIGNEFFFKKDYDNAIKYYEKAVSIDPGYVEAYNNLASAYLQKNDFTNAVKFWKITLLFEPNDLDLYINVALACETKLAQYREAIYYYELFIEKAPQNDYRVPEAKRRIEELKKLLK